MIYWKGFKLFQRPRLHEQVLDGIQFPLFCLFRDLTHAVHNKNLKKKEQITELSKARSFFRERACN